MKEMIMERADELAQEIYEKDFYDLTRDQQNEVWQKAEINVVEDMYDRAEYIIGRV